MRTAATACLVLVVLAAFPAESAVAESALEITFENDSEVEKALAVTLRELVARYPIEGWIFTRRIHIDQNTIPHSHPVLTLHARHREDPERLLATFLHEQFHWFLIEKGKAGDHAMARFAELYPDPPPPSEGGARDRQSCYRHLIVCDLEYQAITQLLGTERAREIMASWTHYQWIYDKVLQDERVRRVNEANGLVLK